MAGPAKKHPNASAVTHTVYSHRYEHLIVCPCHIADSNKTVITAYSGQDITTIQQPVAVDDLRYLRDLRNAAPVSDKWKRPNIGFVESNIYLLDALRKDRVNSGDRYYVRAFCQVVAGNIYIEIAGVG